MHSPVSGVSDYAPSLTISGCNYRKLSGIPTPLRLVHTLPTRQPKEDSQEPRLQLNLDGDLEPVPRGKKLKKQRREAQADSSSVSDTAFVFLFAEKQPNQKRVQETKWDSFRLSKCVSDSPTHMTSRHPNKTKQKNSVSYCSGL